MIWEAIHANQRKSFWLVLLLAIVLVLLGAAAGGGLSGERGGAGIGALVALVVWGGLMLVNLASGEKILLATSGAREVKHADAPQLYNIVEEMKLAGNLSAMPRVYIIDTPVPNAFAVGLKPERSAVAVTTGLLKQLDRDELQGVIAHEIGHIANRDTLFMTLAGVTMGAVILLADIYLRGMMFGGGRRRSSSSKGDNQAAAIMAIVALVLAILAPMMAQLLYFACSRRREYLADASAAQFTRYPEGLARALEKIAGAQGKALQTSKAIAPMFIINPLAAAGSKRGLFSTHPPTTDRIRILRGMTGGDASLAAYEKSFEGSHPRERMLGEQTLRGIAPAEVRAATETQNPAPQRQVKELLHRINQSQALACACGVTLKIPPAFSAATVVCPRCGTRHARPPPLRTASAPAA